LKKIVGAVFPVPHEGVKRLLSGKSDVFAKFGKFRHLAEGQRMLFYDSSVHGIVGEATIEQVIHTDPLDVRERFMERLFLTRKEFDNYVTMSPLGPRKVKNKIMTVCILKNPKEYSRPKGPSKKMNMIGHYLRA
jgi:hypothetical protein